MFGQRTISSGSFPAQMNNGGKICLDQCSELFGELRRYAVARLTMTVG